MKNFSIKILIILLLLLSISFIVDCGGGSPTPRGQSNYNSSRSATGGSTVMPPSESSSATSTPQSNRSLGNEVNQQQVARSIPQRQTPQFSGLKAGFVDDNKQFNYFVHFLQQYRSRIR